MIDHHLIGREGFRHGHESFRKGPEGSRAMLAFVITLCIAGERRAVLIPALLLPTTPLATFTGVSPCCGSCPRARCNHPSRFVLLLLMAVMFSVDQPTI